MPPQRPAGPARVEVDLERQLVFVFNAEAPAQVVILNTSTGGEYSYTNKDGSSDYAYTPEGDYRVYRRYDGVEVAPLGTLYRPLYFVGGWAVHGSPSVPAYPASHGCVRLSNDDQDWLWDHAPDDMEVTVRASTNPQVLAQQAAEAWVEVLGENPDAAPL
jgi:lipoprotein-anchoring transpeptidase ErfK/SrfK